MAAKLADLPLRPSSLKLLQQGGFSSVSEVVKSRDGGIANLAAELGCNLRQAADLFREVQGCLAKTTASSARRNQSLGTAGSNLEKQSSDTGSGISGARTASQILNGKTTGAGKQRQVITFCRTIDDLLGGGIAIGEVTEIAGNPGSGKTQLAMQLSVDARLPIELGGVAGETVYIDTEGNFSPERCYTMANSLVNHVQKVAEKRGPAGTPVPAWLEPDTIMQGVHVFRAYDEAAQTTIITTLPNFLRERTEQGCPVKLVVVDSIAFHYRCSPPGGNYLVRTRSLSTIASLLSDIATSFDVAVVVINQMTTKVGMSKGTDNGESVLVPALGESWAHATTTRLVLSSSSSSLKNESRTCSLVKSPHRPMGVAVYRVCESGIRDSDKAPHVSNPAKRLRS